MILTDQFTNVIYFSDRLEIECPELYRSIVELQDRGVPIKFFEGGKSMWARDYMPIQVTPDGFAAFNYNPSYLNDTTDHQRTITRNGAEICESLFEGCVMRHTDLIIDGGNIIKGDDCVIMTDKILHDNPDCSLTALSNELHWLFYSNVILIPWDRNEPVYGHADGIIRHIDKLHYLYAKYPDRKYIKEVQSHFRNARNDSFYMPSDATIMRQPYPWAYINYIRTKEYIIYPALSPKADCTEDVCVAKQFRRLFANYKPEKIIPVYALPAIKMGGGLHCCSWNVLEKI